MFYVAKKSLKSFCLFIRSFFLLHSCISRLHLFASISPIKERRWRRIVSHFLFETCAICDALRLPYQLFNFKAGIRMEIKQMMEKKVNLNVHRNRNGLTATLHDESKSCIDLIEHNWEKKATSVCVCAYFKDTSNVISITCTQYLQFVQSDIQFGIIIFAIQTQINVYRWICYVSLVSLRCFFIRCVVVGGDVQHDMLHIACRYFFACIS